MMVSCQVKLNGTEAKDNREDFGSTGSDGCVHCGFQLAMLAFHDDHQPQGLDGEHYQWPAF